MSNDEAKPDQSDSSYVSYLDSKRSIDDRSLNHHVLSVLRRELASREQLRVLELGAGIGTMIARLKDWGIIQRAKYTLLDADRTSLSAAAHWLDAWAKRSGKTTAESNGVLHINDSAGKTEVAVELMHTRLEQFLVDDTSRASKIDLLVANAFLDLVDIPKVLPPLLDLLKADGLFWFSINFDGESIFLPEHPADERILGVYHGSMDERASTGRGFGDSRTGRRMFGHLERAGARLLGAGSSDWVVFPVDGTYPEREGEFIEHILATVEAELNWRKEVDQPTLAEWLRTRRSQLAGGELIYIAHQLDFIGRRKE